MSRKFFIFFFLLSAVFFSAQTPLYGLPAAPDSSDFAALDKRIDGYLKATRGESVKEKSEDADMLIASCKDSLLRQHLALKLYDSYLNSPYMGQEAVAIHLTDKWFSTGAVKMANDVDLMNARIYADFNRSSLIGEKAPLLKMKDPDGEEISIPSEEYAGGYSILYFYDTECSKCKVETALLPALFEKEKPSVIFYAIYVGDNAAKWEKYRSEKLDFDIDGVTVVHAWDPDIDSDFQRKYGVLQTPGVFLLDKKDVIIGRKLDVGGLGQIFSLLPDIHSYEYGSDESAAFFDKLFQEAGGSVSSDEVKEAGRGVLKSTLPKGDTVGFRHLAGDFLYYLSSKRGEAFHEGLSYVVDSLVLSRPDVWTSYEDRLKVVTMAEMMKETLSLSPVGSVVPYIKVPGVLRSWKSSRGGRHSFRKLRGDPGFLMFYSEGCGSCREEMAAFDAMLSVARGADSSALSGQSPSGLSGDDGSVSLKSLEKRAKRIRILLVNMDEVEEDDPSLAETLRQNFDLSALPLIIQLDRKGVITRRYLSF